MLKTTHSDAALSALGNLTPASSTSAARRRSGSDTVQQPASLPQPVVAARMPGAHGAPGTDVYGRVVRWDLFGTACRNERQAHQSERARQAQTLQQTQEQAELAAEAARAQSAHHTAGLMRVQACRDLVSYVKRRQDEAQQTPQQEDSDAVAGATPGAGAGLG